MSQKKAKQQRREIRRQQEAIQQRLAEQLRLLTKRCRDFDQGDWGEAVDIATRLRVIFNRGSKSKPSVLQSLDAQKTRILTTCEPREDSDNILEAIGGLYTQIFSKDENGTAYRLVPRLDGGQYSYKAEIPATRWWDQTIEIVAHDAGKIVYTRKDVITEVANQDGAHVAIQISEAYDVLSRPGGIITLTNAYEDGTTTQTPIPGVHFAMLRQMAYEVLNSREMFILAGLVEK